MTNAGYEIENMIYTGRYEGVALGHNTKTNEWVTWFFRETAKAEAEKTFYNFFLVHYAVNEKYARADFCERIANEYKFKASLYEDEAEWLRIPTF